MSDKEVARIPLTLFATAPPSWWSREEALDYLGGEFVERLTSLGGCGKTSFAGANLGFGGRFRLHVERNCASGRLPVLRQSLAGVFLPTEHQVEHSNGLIRTRL